MNTNLPVPQLSINYLRNLTARLKTILSVINTSITRHEAITAPTTGAWAQSDIVWNSTPTELGSVSSKYTIMGWICVVGGEPGTWLELRCLTGN